VYYEDNNSDEDGCVTKIRFRDINKKTIFEAGERNGYDLKHVIYIRPDE